MWVTRIVIMGGGPAGYEAALVAAQHGSDVTVVERDGMGGACVLDDCVPSKTLISSAGLRVDLHRAPDLGLTADREAIAVDLPVVNERVKGLARAHCGFLWEYGFHDASGHHDFACFQRHAS